LRWTRQRRARDGAGRAGSPCEPETACGRAALKSGEAFWRSWMSCVRQNRVVLAVVATVKPVAEMCASPTGQTASSIRGAREARRKVRLPGEHGISRPTIAQGRPSDWHHLYAAVRFFCATFSRSGPRVRGQHPVFPAPSRTRGWSDQAKLGRIAPRGREGMSARWICKLEEHRSRLILRHCEQESVARQTPLSCPGRSAASRRRCAMESGSISPRLSVWPSGSRLCGTRERRASSTPACCPGCPARTSGRRSRSARRFR